MDDDDINNIKNMKDTQINQHIYSDATPIISKNQLKDDLEYKMTSKWMLNSFYNENLGPASSQNEFTSGIKFNLREIFDNQTKKVYSDYHYEDVPYKDFSTQTFGELQDNLNVQFQ